MPRFMEGRLTEVSIHAVTAEDYDAAIGLVPGPEQQRFIATNADSLAEAAQNPSCRPMIIAAGGVPVGFAMAALDSDDGNEWIYRFMIDQRYQGRGYGAQALDLLARQIFVDTGCPRIMLGVKPDNAAAIRLYERAGFRPAGFEFDGEIAFCMERSAFDLRSTS